MDCPYCRQPLPTTDVAVCPACGQPLPPPLATPPSSPPHQRVRVNWLLFFVVLLAPPLLTILVAQGGRKTEGVAISVALLGGGAAGLACGIILGTGVGNTATSKIVLSLTFAAVLSVLCIGLSCCGCLASGFRMDFR